MLDRVTAALAAIRGEGSFAVEQACPSGDLQLSVEGVGPLRFPITPAVARKLRSVARPAPFGRRAQTVHDPSVRDTWEIGKDRIQVDARRWARTLRPQLAALQKGLGLPEGTKLVAALDKMLVYEPGQFFAPHQDSERSRDMVASLVVELPSKSTGGAVIVEHGPEKLVFCGAPRGPLDLSLLAFYADCHHEVQPVTSGFRIVLTLHLLRRGGPALPRRDHTAEVERLASAVQAFFATPIQEEYSNEPPQRPDRLVYLLDHEYTQQSLGWGHLKNADEARAKALTEVADRLDCEILLALADVHEMWQCEDDWEPRGRYGWRGYDEDDEGDVERTPESHELIDLIEEEIELRHWVDRDGKSVRSVATMPGSDEICFTRPSSELHPFRSEHEGYMGNYGNTVDRWYHRAAVVLWPRERDFVIRAKVSPAWAVKKISALARKGKIGEAREKAHSLLPFWRGTAAQEKSERFVLDLLAVASALGEGGLAGDMLAPLGPSRLTAEAAPAFAALVERHGAAWGKKLFSTWAERDHMRFGEPPWLPLLPGICQALKTGAPRHGETVASWLLAREVRSFEQRHKDSLALPPALLGEPARARDRGDLVSFFEAAAVIGAASVREDLLAFLTAPRTALPALDAGELLQQCREGRPPAAVRALGLGPLHRHVMASLEGALSAPPRSPDDWSIEPHDRCGCALCEELSAFLRAPARVEHRWPLATDRRAHVHGAIDGQKLPVSHVTERRGRPYTLVLKKQKALFEIAAATRARQKEMLAWLRRNRRAFEAPTAAGT